MHPALTTAAKSTLNRLALVSSVFGLKDIVDDLPQANKENITASIASIFMGAASRHFFRKAAQSEQPCGRKGRRWRQATSAARTAERHRSTLERAARPPPR